MFLQDLRFAFRTLRKAPAFSLTVALVLALGLGSTVLMFAIVNSVLLKGPPFPEAERLFTLWQRIPQEPRVSFSPHEFVAWQEQTQTFESLAFVTGTGFVLSGRGDPELIIGRVATPSLFQVLRAPAALGRVFTEEERDAQVVVLTHALWRDKFNRRPDVLGQAITLNGQPYTIIGVLPESFELDGPQARLFVPASLASPNFAQNPNAHFLRVVGRLKAETTRAQLEAEMKLLGPRVVAPDDDTDRRFFALSLQELTTGELRAPLLVLLGAVAFLLLIACANVANLMLARSHARQAEMAIRAALGASRPRLIAQLLTESTLLALIGGAAGLALATWGLELLRRFAAADVPELLHAQIDPLTLGFALIAAAGVGICLGLGPALAVGHTSFQGALKGATRTTAGSERLRQSLVFAEVAIAVVLLVGCALMLRSFSALLGVDPGFRPAGVVIANLFLSEERYADALKMTQFYRASLDAVRRLPGVEASGLVTHLPFDGNSWGNSFAVEGIAPPPPDAEPTAQIRPISRGYFAAMGIPLRAGRDFIAHDDVSSTGVAVVNELFAHRFWPNESPLGHRLRY
ncbi:MAG: ABC transporter permease, partial [Chthoniobacterales bacterium]|nr:ABC transporter permease [Chthoniobacterales bacterium]